MLLKVNKMKRILWIILIAQVIVLAFLALALHIDILIPSIILVIEIAIIVYLVESYANIMEEQSSGVETTLGSTAKEAYLMGGVGLVNYDEDYVITWMSELFKNRNIERVGHKVLTWLPEVDDLIAGKCDSVQVQLDDRIYYITRKNDAPVLMFKDITEEETLAKKNKNEQVVLGLASFDNYEETTSYADEADVSSIDTAVRKVINEYCDEYNIVLKRLNNSRYLMILNEEIFQRLMKDRFSVLQDVSKAAQAMGVPITLSMSFAKGGENLEELDEMSANLLDLAQTRGGDQVAVQSVGEDVQYFGGSREATEKRSRVRVRVISHALRDLIMHSSNVIICGHKTADFDCIGSAIALSKMASALHKSVSIIAKTGGIEEKLAAAMEANKEQLASEVNFITEGEALNQLQDNTLVIMTDHHNKNQSNGAKVLDVAKKVMIIDHHRRSTDIGVKPTLVYIEAAASSTCELVTEMIPYVAKKTDISELDAVFMLAGMTIDTQRWRVRCGTRTYEAASELRKYGADPQVVEEYLKDTYDEFTLKSHALSVTENYDHGIVIAPVKKGNLSRALMSQIAENLLGIQGVNASFVIAHSEAQTCISARSNGKINVQVIMEAMGGGGHLTSAAVQKDETNIDLVKDELCEVIDHFLQEDDSDESDIEE